jgi:hypothetical protein
MNSHPNQGEQVNHPERPAQTPSPRTGLSAALRGIAAPSLGPARAFLLAAALLVILALGAPSAFAASPPALTIAAPSAITYHSAHLTGTVNPEGEAGSAPTTWSFEYSADAGATWAPLASHEISAPAAEEANPVAVAEDLTGLGAGHPYLVRLTATNATGPTTSAEKAFSTEAVAAPSASGLTVSAATSTTAHFEGTVNSGGSGAGESTATYAFSCEPACPGLPPPAPITADGTNHQVEATASGLVPNTTYALTLTALSPGGEVKANKSFLTAALAPSAATLPFEGPASSTAVRLYGSVDPHNSPTTYFFEYGPANCESSECASIPATQDASASSANATVTVSQDLTGLAPSTEYHYRLVAHSAAGTVRGADRTLSTAAAPEACPNQQRRSEDNSTQLPDCRSWEQVTPAFKAGALLTTTAISTDGSRLIGPSGAVFAGTEGYGRVNEAFYESVRTDSGWATSAVNPPFSLYPVQEFRDANPDLGRSLWAVRRSSQSVNTEDLAIREPSGDFVKIGPLAPPAATEGPPAGQSTVFPIHPDYVYRGASPDLSRVFYTIRRSGHLWPGDTSAGGENSPSLYEYIGTENTEPHLVGISDEGTPATVAASHLISDCDTALGSYQPPGGDSDDTYNAISGDGEAVFFTAVNGGECGSSNAPAVDELYARVGQGEAAHTVAISEPTVGPTGDCEACDETAPAAGVFQGASRDGSKVFFFSTQQLFSGTEGEAGVNLYEYDFDAREGEKVSFLAPDLAEANGRPGGVARVSEDGSHVYFVSSAVLTGGPNSEGNAPSFGADNLYVFERDASHPDGRLAYIATLTAADAQDWNGEDDRPVQATPDGRFLVFQSSADLTSGDTSSVPQVFEYDAAREELVRISIGEVGYAAGVQSADSHESSITVQRYSQSAEVSTSMVRLALSNDGSTVVFQSQGGLSRTASAAAEAELESVYRYHSEGTLADGEASALSNGSGTFRSRASAGIDASGDDVFFETLAPLLASDGDTQWDVYDAREGGGFPAPAAPSICTGEGCQGTPAPPSPKAAPATPGFNGPGNQLQCPKGKLAKGGRCVKKQSRHKKKGHKKHGRANTNRRTNR